jgi:hypothetical protein
MSMRGWLSAIVIFAACGGKDAVVPEEFADAAPEVPPDAGEPETLAETGLYGDPASETLAPGVVEYQVNWELWSDGASKRRWILLPEGEAIDTADMDFWTVPVGTKIWKEFTRDDIRIETRFIWKRGPALEDWFAVAFAWNADGTEAVAEPVGEDDALGTGHDIPKVKDCERCHLRQPDFVLGFTALQLDHEQGSMNLGALIAADALSDPPAGSSPYFPLPGAGPAPAALGVLHGNCGGCHHSRSATLEETPLQLRLEVGGLATVEETSTYTTAVGQPEMKPLGDPVTALIEAGNMDASAVWVRMGLRGDMTGMPPLASEDVDMVGRMSVGTWIDEL